MGDLIGGLDIAVFVIFVISVVGLGLFKSRVKAEDHHKKKTGEDYFLAGRGLSWWLVGFSLIAANISTEQFVGMSGEAAAWLGMAIASYEWMAAITLVFVAFVFLPKFLKSGIYTIPEFLEYRYNTFARSVMAISTLVILVGVPTASVIYSGAKVICVFFAGQTLFGMDLGSITVGCWIIGVLAAVYVFVGGLKACAWADLLQGAALIVGGAVIAYYAFNALGGADTSTLSAVAGDLDMDKLSSMGAIERFKMLNGGALPEGKLHMIRPLNDAKIPWSALVLGLWIPNFFYWGLNQYITQRTLGSKSLAEGQKGVVFAALLKLIIPFVVVIPGILAFNLFRDKLQDQATNKNNDMIVAYEKNLANPAGAKMVFRFNDEFVEFNSELADDLLAFNAAVVGIEVDSTLTPVKANALLVDAAKNANRGKLKGQRITIQPELVGHDYDAAFPILLRNLLPVGRGILGFVLAAIFGAVVSSLASMLNSASTIATMDIYNKLRKGASSQFELVTSGRVFVVLFVLTALWIAPNLGNPAFGGIFNFIQEFQGFISPGILTVFIFGLLIHKAPRMVGTIGLLLNPVLYGLFKFSPKIPVLKNIEVLNWIAGRSFLDRMGACFIILIIVLTIVTLVKPLPKPVVLPVNEKMDMTTSFGTKIFGLVVVALTVLLYVIFF
jgi:SSS family solute:Na+ symporter